MDMVEYKGGHTPTFIKFAEAPYKDTVAKRDGSVLLFKIRTDETRLFAWDDTTGDTAIIERKPLNRLAEELGTVGTFYYATFKGVEYNGKLYI